jgi:hypothetical protein
MLGELQPKKRANGAALALILLLVVAGAQRMWNAYAVPPLSGYDTPGHAAYMLTIIEEGRLPHPHAGWSTFHPPLYYLLGAGVWAALDVWGPKAVVTGIRMIGSLAGLAAGLVAFLLLRHLGYGSSVAWVATAVLVFIPVAQLAGAMIGNEAFASGLVALALPAVLVLQVDPRNLRAAAVAGLLAGLAVAAKFTGIFVLAACAVPFVRRSVDRRVATAAAVCFLTVAVVAGPTYVRNLAITGTPVPMTRHLEPMKGAEAGMVIRPRRLVDFLWVPPNCILHPSLFPAPGKRAFARNINMTMTSVWGLTYAGAWFDPLAVRTPRRTHQGRMWNGAALALLGLAPTLTTIVGFGAALANLLRRRGDTPDAPLVVAAAVGLAFYVCMTAAVPSTAAVKCSYLLGLAVPAAAFFARGVALAGPRLRVVVLGLSSAAALLAGVVFTSGLVYPVPQRHNMRGWLNFAAQLPDSHMSGAIEYLTRGWL